jgi:uncharacterized protein (DUF58 family)
MTEINLELLRNVQRRIVTHKIATSWRSSDPLAGNRRGARKDLGGFEFVGQSPFVPGDNFRDVDWVSSNLPGAGLIVNRYRDFHPMKVFVLCDVGPGMEFGTQRVSKRILGAEIAGSAISSLFKTQDTASVIAYNQHNVVHYSQPSNPRSTLTTGLHGIISAPVTGPRTTGSGLIKAISYLPQSERCLVFLLLSYTDFTDRERRAIKLVAGLHDFRCIFVQDLRERELPQGRGLFTLEDIATGARRVFWLSEQSRQQFAEDSRLHHAAFLQFFESMNVLTAVLSTEMDLPVVSKALRRLFGGIRHGRSAI